MKLKTFLSIAAFLALLFGLGFFLVPVQTMAMYGVDLNISGQSIARYAGSAYLGIAVILWFTRKFQATNPALQAIFLGGLTLTITSFIVALMDVFKGEGNNLIWSNVLLHFLLAVGFAYFRFGKPGNT